MATIPPSTNSDGFSKQQRPCAFFNTTQETIPPFAAMQKATWNGSEACQRERAGEVVWDVRKCTAEAESRQDAAEFIFNGSVPCPPNTPGRGTEDYPCQALFNGAEGRISSGVHCGPKKDSWALNISGTAFICTSTDIVKAAGTSQVYSIWVRPRSAPNLRWFELIDDLVSLGEARAYWTQFSGGRWVRDSDAAKIRTIHSTVPGIVGSGGVLNGLVGPVGEGTPIGAIAGDFVLCLLNPATYLWEVVSAKPPQKKFGVTMTQLSHGGSVNCQRLVRLNGTWQRINQFFTAFDIFLNSEDTIEENFVISTTPYTNVEGVTADVIDGMYCAAADWLEDE